MIKFFILPTVSETVWKASFWNSGLLKWIFEFWTTRERVDTKFFKSCIMKAEMLLRDSIFWEAISFSDNFAFKIILAAWSPKVLNSSKSSSVKRSPVISGPKVRNPIRISLAIKGIINFTFIKSNKNLFSSYISLPLSPRFSKSIISSFSCKCLERLFHFFIELSIFFGIFKVLAT